MTSGTGANPRLPFADVVNSVQPVKSPVAKSPLLTRVSAFEPREKEFSAAEIAATANMLFLRKHPP
jgi:hypothetical protein